MKALRKQLETEKQHAAAKQAELDAREAEFAAREAEHAAASKAAQAAREAELAAASEAAQAGREGECSGREHEHSSGEVELASTTLVRPAVEPEAPQEAGPVADVTARPDVVEAVEHEAAEEDEHASASAAAGGGDLPHAAVLDTATASDTGSSVHAPVSYKQLLQEVAALRQRLHDSSFEVVAGTPTALPNVFAVVSAGFMLNGSCCGCWLAPATP